MPIDFVARVAGVDDEFRLVAGVAERNDGVGRALIFQAADEPPDEDDVELGMDTYCVVTENQGTAHGCVRELSIDGDRLHVVVSDEALGDLGLDRRRAPGAVGGAAGVGRGSAGPPGPHPDLWAARRATRGVAAVTGTFGEETATR